MVDIGDEQSIEASLSTFTSHLRHLDAMCKTADERTLCLIDEIGDGTDPDEGAALAVAALEALLECGAIVVATTHYGRIKTFALKTDGVANASMAFEDAEGRPLYRLLQGIAGRSRGIETARRTGFDSRVLKAAESYLGADAFRLEAILSDLEASHLALEREREQLAQQSAALESAIDRYEEKVAAYDVSKKEADKRAGREAEAFLLQTRREIEAIVKEIRENQARREVLRKTRTRLEEMLATAQEKRKPPAPESPPAAPAGPVAVGDWVAINPSGEPAGRVIAVENGSATIEINNKRIKLDIDALYSAQIEGKDPPSGVTYDVQVEPLSSTQLDVRGSRREEALEAVNRFVDRAVLSGVQEITIIHGVGEGILAAAVRAALETDRRIESIRSGGLGEGGAGVTVVTLR
jgi:DNA mismatch repair protein MutS2